MIARSSFTPTHTTQVAQHSYHTLAQSPRFQTGGDGELDSLTIAFLGHTRCNKLQLWGEIPSRPSHGHIEEQVAYRPALTFSPPHIAKTLTKLALVEPTQLRPTRGALPSHNVTTRAVQLPPISAILAYDSEQMSMS